MPLRSMRQRATSSSPRHLLPELNASLVSRRSPFLPTLAAAESPGNHLRTVRTAGCWKAAPASNQRDVPAPVQHVGNIRLTTPEIRRKVEHHGLDTSACGVTAGTIRIPADWTDERRLVLQADLLSASCVVPLTHSDDREALWRRIDEAWEDQIEYMREAG